MSTEQSFINNELTELNEKQKAVVTLVLLGNLNGFHIDSITAKYGLSVQQYNALRVTRGMHPKPVSVSFIKGKMAYKNSDVSRIMARLADADFVKPADSKIDKRVKCYVLTSKGQEVLTKLDKVEAELYKAAKNLTNEEAAQLNHLFAKMLLALND